MKTVICSALAVTLVLTDARADVLESYGTSVTVGVGYANFVNREMSRYANDGAAWDVRFGFGTKTTFAVEAAYVGSLHPVDAEGLASNAWIASHGIEWALRYNLRMPKQVEPYLLAGAGWSRYRLDSTTNASTMGSGDDVAVLPLGLGVTIRKGRAILDARLVYRATTRTDMVLGRDASFDTWNVGARIGFEY